MKVRHAVAMLAIPAGVVGLSAAAAFAEPVPGASTAPPATGVVGTGGSTQPSTGSTQPSTVQAVAATSSPSGSSLPVTGGDIAGLTIIGIGLLGGGTVLVRRTRAKTSD